MQLLKQLKPVTSKIDSIFEPVEDFSFVNGALQSLTVHIEIKAH